MNAYIYGLVDPFNNKIRYIGQTMQQIEKRLIDHINESKSAKINKDTTRKQNWINSILKRNRKITTVLIEKIENYTSDLLDEREEYWIKYYKKNNLTNSTNGGKHMTKKIWDYHRAQENKLIYSYCELNENIEEWKTARIAASIINCEKNSITKAISGKNRYKNLFWAYDPNLFKTYNIRNDFKYRLILVENKKNNFSRVYKGMWDAMKDLNIPKSRKNSISKVINNQLPSFWDYTFTKVAHLKSDELLESCNANQQPSPIKSEIIINGKVQRLIVEEIDSNKTNTSVGQSKSFRQRLRDKYFVKCNDFWIDDIVRTTTNKKL